MKPDADQIIMGALTSAAEQGAYCPTADDLSDMIDSNAVSTTVAIIHRLERRGLVKVERYQRSRRVTIVETGCSTAEPANKAPHWRVR